MTDKLQCPKCNSTDIIGIEYAYGIPEHYDGISEWNCNDCHIRWGRWSGQILKENEREKRYGDLTWPRR